MQTRRDFMRSSIHAVLTHWLTSAAIVLTVIAGLLGWAIDAHAQATDPKSVFDGFHAAVNAHNVDAALAFFADDAVVQFPNQPPPNVHRGTAEIRTWLQGDADQHIQVATEQLVVAGDKLTWIAKVDVDDVRALGITLEGSVEAVVQNGKIKSFSFTLSDATLAKLAAATSQPPALPQTGAAPDLTWMLVLVGLGMLCCGGLLLRCVGKG
jgi:ketosteroid isomerase-like protein